MASPPPFWDVNGDDFVSPVDALLVINFLNDLANGESEAAFVQRPFFSDRLLARAVSRDSVAASTARPAAVLATIALHLNPAGRRFLATRDGLVARIGVHERTAWMDGAIRH